MEAVSSADLCNAFLEHTIALSFFELVEEDGFGYAYIFHPCDLASSAQLQLKQAGLYAGQAGSRVKRRSAQESQEILFLQLYYSIRISPMGNSCLFPPGESQLRQSRATQPTVQARCFSGSIIRRTLTWATGSLTFTQVLMHAIAHGGVRTPYESLH